jgi:pyridoxine/pyridoxamine 5'-phosphate oxidase
VEGVIERLSLAENLEYFNSEPLNARIRSVICKQSQRVSESRRQEILEEAQNLLRRCREDPTFKVEMPESFGATDSCQTPWSSIRGVEMHSTIGYFS